MPFDVTCGNHEHTEKYMHACKWSKNVALGVVYQWHCRFLIYLLIWESKHFKRQFNFQRNKRVKTPEISLADVPWQFYTLFPHADGPNLWSHPPLFLFDFVSSLAAREKCSFLLEKENCIATQWWILLPTQISQFIIIRNLQLTWKYCSLIWKLNTLLHR